MRARTSLLIAVLAAALVVAACGTDEPAGEAQPTAATPTATSPIDDDDHGAGEAGEPADAADADRTVEIEALDIRFEPDSIEVMPGEVITFSIHNGGEAPHEFVLGTRAMQEEHEHEMGDMDGEMTDDPNAVSLDPGETATLTWRFPDSGEVLYGCHEPGHYDAGMVGTVHIR